MDCINIETGIMSPKKLLNCPISSILICKNSKLFDLAGIVQSENFNAGIYHKILTYKALNYIDNLNYPA